MSSTIDVFVVHLQELKRVIGSGNAALLGQILESRADDLQRINQIDEAEATSEDALARLINGTVSEDIPGYFYGYALRIICSVVGKELPNICGISGASQWIEDVDAILE